MSEGCAVDFGDASDDAEQVEFYDAKVVKARKPHVCTECSATISVGEEYRRISYRFEGGFHVDHQCSPCHEAAGEFEFNLVGGMLWESFEHEWDEGARLQACLNRLESARAKTHMQAQWQKWHAKREAFRLRMRERRKSAGAVDPHDGGTPA